MPSQTSSRASLGSPSPSRLPFSARATVNNYAHFRADDDIIDSAKVYLADRRRLLPFGIFLSSVITRCFCTQAQNPEVLLLLQSTLWSP